jgi:hypothetical protein
VDGELGQHKVISGQSTEASLCQALNLDGRIPLRLAPRVVMNRVEGYGMKRREQ